MNTRLGLAAVAAGMFHSYARRSVVTVMVAGGTTAPLKSSGVVRKMMYAELLKYLFLNIREKTKR